jgi:glutamate 5-kinase
MMAKEPKIDRTKWQSDIGCYFRDCPDNDILVYDRRLRSEPTEDYAKCTDISGIDTLIVKVGTSIVTHDEYQRAIYNMNCLSEDLTRLRSERGFNVLLISSGAIGLGRKARLRKGERIPESEKKIPEQKRLDAIDGQYILYELWRHHFYPQAVGESLVTHDDMRDPQKRQALLNRYTKWYTQNKIPIINEHDAKSIEEIDIMLKGERTFRDNDGLASLHAQLLKKAGYNPLMVLLSNTDGIYTAESFRNGEYTPIRIVKDSTGLEEQALPISSTRGRGGVLSKIEASRNAADEGVPVVIANGQYCNHDSHYMRGKSGTERKYKVLESILDGKVVGTRFLPKGYATR